MRAVRLLLVLVAAASLVAFAACEDGTTPDCTGVNAAECAPIASDASLAEAAADGATDAPAPTDGATDGAKDSAADAPNDAPASSDAADAGDAKG